MERYIENLRNRPLNNLNTFDIPSYNDWMKLHQKVVNGIETAEKLSALQIEKEHLAKESRRFEEINKQLEEKLKKEKDDKIYLKERLAKAETKANNLSTSFKIRQKEFKKKEEKLITQSMATQNRLVEHFDTALTQARADKIRMRLDSGEKLFKCEKELNESKRALNRVQAEKKKIESELNAKLNLEVKSIAHQKELEKLMQEKEQLTEISIDLKKKNNELEGELRIIATDKNQLKADFDRAKGEKEKTESELNAKLNKSAEKERLVKELTEMKSKFDKLKEKVEAIHAIFP